MTANAPASTLRKPLNPPRYPPRRASAVDAMRGISILGMILAANVPWDLPLGVERWLVHAQTPPPSHAFQPQIPGINGIDLVFPFFLFCLGIAVPLSLARRLEYRAPWWTIAGSLLWRGLLLTLFAFYIPHVRPWEIREIPTPGVWLRGLAAFVVLFAVFLRLPSRWPSWWRAAVRLAGWSAAVALVVTVRFSNGQGPLPPDATVLPRFDWIMWILAHVVIGTSAAWLLTRERPVARLGILAGLAAVHLACGVEGGWVHAVWNWKPEAVAAVWERTVHLPWLWRTEFLDFATIALMGTFVGDLLQRWLVSGDPGEAEATAPPPGWSRMQAAALIGLSVWLVGFVVWGLFTRHVVVTIVGSALLIGGGLRLVRRAASDTETLLATIFRFGVTWLTLGLLLEPFEGGIKKDPPTLSFYFTTAGLACFTLVALMVTMGVFRRRRLLGFLADAGQNPLMAYIGHANLIQPVLALTGIAGLVGRTVTSPWGELAYAMATTLLVAAVAGFCTRKRIFWRA